jgi:transposase
MIGRETRMLLRHYLAQGASKSALARQLGISRDTIHRWIRSGALDRDLESTPVRYGPRRPVPTKLDAYKAIIETRLAAYPALSAVRLLAEIKPIPSRSAVRPSVERHVRCHRPSHVDTALVSQLPPFLRRSHYWCSPCRSFPPGASFFSSLRSWS